MSTHPNELLELVSNSIKAIAQADLHDYSPSVFSAFQPLTDHLVTLLASEGYNPFDKHHGYGWLEVADQKGADWIETFRGCVQEYMALPPSEQDATTPGTMAVRQILEGYSQNRNWDDRDIENVQLTSVDDEDDELLAFVWLEQFVERCVEGTGLDVASVADQLSEHIKEEVTARWIDEAVKEGVTSGARAEFVYFPTWTGGEFNIDQASYRLSLQSSGQSTYLDELEPNEGLRKFLEYVNVGTDEFIAAASARNPDEGAKLDSNLQGFVVKSDPDRLKVVSAENLVTMIENVGSTSAFPVIHAYVDIAALFEMDPRLPVKLPLRKDEVHIGLHNFNSGCGYMDTYPGAATIDLSTCAFAGDEFSYGIDKTYGLVLSCFYCTPENVKPAEPKAAQADAVVPAEHSRPVRAKMRP